MLGCCCDCHFVLACFRLIVFGCFVGVVLVSIRCGFNSLLIVAVLIDVLGGFVLRLLDVT